MELENKTVLSHGGVAVTAGSPAGAAYVSKVTHPPTVIPADYQGVPDCSAPNVVRIETKAEVNIPINFRWYRDEKIVEEVVSSKVLFLSTSGAYGHAIPFYWKDGSWWQAISYPSNPSKQIGPTAVVGKGFSFRNWPQDVTAYRTTYGSQTFYLNATEFNNQGVVTSAKFRPAITMIPWGEILGKQPDDKARRQLLEYGAGLKYQLIKGSSYDEIVKALGDAFMNSMVQIFNIGSASAVVDNTSSVESGFTNAFPSVSSDVFTLSSKASTRPAKDGAFVVQQPSGPVQPWVPVFPAKGYDYPQSSPCRGTPCFIALGYPTPKYVPLFVGDTSGDFGPGSGGFVYDTTWNNLDWSWTLFEGLTVDTGNVQTSLPYITVKTFRGLEAQPAIDSTLSSFAGLLPLPDSRALEMVTGMFHARPDGLPASANDLGTIAATAVKFLPTAVTWLKDLFGSPAQKSKAMNSAHEFVKPKTKAEKDQKAEARTSREVESLRQQVKTLSLKLGAQANLAKQNGASLPTNEPEPDNIRQLNKSSATRRRRTNALPTTLVFNRRHKKK